MPETATGPDVETISGLIQELFAVMSGRSPHSVDDATSLEGFPVGHLLFAIQQCFGVQVPPDAVGPETRNVGQLSQSLGKFVHGVLETRLQGQPRVSDARRVLLIGGLTVPEFQQAAARRGWRAGMFAYYDRAQGGATPRAGDNPVLDQVEAVDWANPFDVVRRIVELYDGGQIAGVVANDEFGLLPAALATTQLGIAGVSLRAVHNTRDKFHMRRILEEAGLGQLRYAVCRDLAEAQSFLELVGGPIILKPVTGTGSEGVSRVSNSEELAAAFQTAAGAAGFSGILCEEFIDGPEVSLEGYCIDGRFVAVALTDKITDERFLELGHQQPSSHPPSVFQAAAETAGRVLAALGVENGVTHTEFRISDRGPVLIETHTRMGGDYIHVLTRLTTGVDLADLMVAFSLGETVDALPVDQGRAAAIRFVVGRPGQVRAVRVPAAEEGNGLHSVLGPPIGKTFTGLSASRERLAHVIATGPTAEAAGKTAESFLAQVHVDYFDR
jgi:biotin carboxylase